MDGREFISITIDLFFFKICLLFYPNFSKKANERNKVHIRKEVEKIPTPI